MITDAQGDSISLTYVISSPGSTFNDGAYADSTITDTLTSQPIEDCNIDFNTIDSAYVASVQNIGSDSVLVVWTIVDGNGSFQITNTYYIPGSNIGVYSFELNLYCPQKANGSVYKFRVNYFLDESAVSVETEVLTQALNVYPNPSDENITIEVADWGTALNYAIYDMKGAQVSSGQLEQQTTKLNISALQPGIYLVRVEGSKPVRIMKK